MAAGRILQSLVIFLVVAAPPTARSDTAAPAHTELGTFQGAAYRVDVPAHWNHGLVVYFHGYSLQPGHFERTRLDPPFQAIVDRGFALIQSGYSDGGWIIQRAAADSEALRRHFVARHGKPRETYAVGMSMGGALAALALERMPGVYTGGLSLCGAVAPSLELNTQRDFSLRAAFDFYFPGLLGSLVPVADGYLPDAATATKIRRALDGNPRAAKALLALYAAPNLDVLAGEVTFDGYIVKDLQRRAGGNPFGNADLIYVGTDDDTALNRGVHRYAADPKAVQYLVRNVTLTGKLQRPLLELHTLHDPTVPAPSTFAYAMQVLRHGDSANFVQQYVVADGHCTFAPGQIDRAFGELLEWTQHGRRPPAGLLPQ